MQSCQSSWVVYRLLASVIAQAYCYTLQHNIGSHEGMMAYAHQVQTVHALRCS